MSIFKRRCTYHKIDWDKVETVADVCAILKLVGSTAADDGTDTFKDVRKFYEEK